MRDFLGELKRRNVYKVAAAYLVAAFVVLQLAELAAGAAAGCWYLMGASEDGANRAEEAPDRSIAVLPFDALSRGEDAQTFARGIHDDLLTKPFNVSGLTVISRTAVEKYRDTGLTTGQIADSLRVRWVMEGGVEILGQEIQVNAQLIDPRTETHAWADSYRRELTAESLFDLQSDITKRIARSMEAELTSDETRRVEDRPTRNLDAYRFYARGRRALARRTAGALDSARTYFEMALEQDSTYALAWVGRAYPLRDPPPLSPPRAPGSPARRSALRRRDPGDQPGLGVGSRRQLARHPRRDP